MKNLLIIILVGLLSACTDVAPQSSLLMDAGRFEICNSTPAKLKFSIVEDSSGASLARAWDVITPDACRSFAAQIQTIAVQSVDGQAELKAAVAEDRYWACVPTAFPGSDVHYNGAATSGASPRCPVNSRPARFTSLSYEVVADSPALTVFRVQLNANMFDWKAAPPEGEGRPDASSEQIRKQEELDRIEREVQDLSTEIADLEYQLKLVDEIDLSDIMGQDLDTINVETLKSRLAPFTTKASGVLTSSFVSKVITGINDVQVRLSDILRRALIDLEALNREFVTRMEARDGADDDATYQSLGLVRLMLGETQPLGSDPTFYTAAAAAFVQEITKRFANEFGLSWEASVAAFAKTFAAYQTGGWLTREQRRGEAKIAYIQGFTKTRRVILEQMTQLDKDGFKAGVPAELRLAIDQDLKDVAPEAAGILKDAANARSVAYAAQTAAGLSAMVRGIAAFYREIHTMKIEAERRQAERAMAEMVTNLADAIRLGSAFTPAGVFLDFCELMTKKQFCFGRDLSQFEHIMAGVSLALPGAGRLMLGAAKQASVGIMAAKGLESAATARVGAASIGAAENALLTGTGLTASERLALAVEATSDFTSAGVIKTVDELSKLGGGEGRFAAKARELVDAAKKADHELAEFSLLKPCLALERGPWRGILRLLDAVMLSETALASTPCVMPGEVLADVIGRMEDIGVQVVGRLSRYNAIASKMDELAARFPETSGVNILHGKITDLRELLLQALREGRPARANSFQHQISGALAEVEAAVQIEERGRRLLRFETKFIQGRIKKTADLVSQEGAQFVANEVKSGKRLMITPGSKTWARETESIKKMYKAIKEHSIIIDGKPVYCSKIRFIVDDISKEARNFIEGLSDQNLEVVIEKLSKHIE